MQKIIWISSYPKSGNTWIMFLIANYFFNIERKDNFEIVKKLQFIKQELTDIRDELEEQHD